MVSALIGDLAKWSLNSLGIDANLAAAAPAAFWSFCLAHVLLIDIVYLTHKILGNIVASVVLQI